MRKQVPDRHHRGAGMPHVLVDHLAVMLVASVEILAQLDIR
jgi:hypothetical protein